MSVVKPPGFVAVKIKAEIRRLWRKVKRRADRLLHPAVHKRRLGNRQTEFEKTSQAERFREGDDTFVLYRIVGNALVPHQDPGQVIQNLAFQLDNEPELFNCRKIWIVNRIFEPSMRDAVLSLLADRQAEHFEIPFDLDDYRQIDSHEDELRIDALLQQLDTVRADVQDRANLAKLRLKRLYVMNNNGARNEAIKDGRGKAKWILPWDGNCFLTAAAWERIVRDVKASSYLPYHLVYMARVTDNADAIDQAAVPDASHEPQIIFHRESCDLFDEAIPYGRRPKVELLQRLGVPGPWRYWANDPWDVDSRQRSPFELLYARSSGWVYRLSSGHLGSKSRPDVDQQRHRNRNEAIRQTIAHLDSLEADLAATEHQLPISRAS